MRVPFLKYFILKTLSTGEATGYEVIKQCEERLGYRPSTGSVYPLLKDMEASDVIQGEKHGRRTCYQLTEKGRRMLEEGEQVKKEAYQKLRQYALQLAEIFEDEALRHMMRRFDESHEAFPLIYKIRTLSEDLHRQGIARDRIHACLAGAYRRLQSLTEGKHEAN
ncbi:MAG: PadR family transcriptional regulator [Thermoplasmatota archaeon]